MRAHRLALDLSLLTAPLFSEHPGCPPSASLSFQLNSRSSVERVSVQSAPTDVSFVWTERPDGMGQSRDTADPLGFRAAAVRVAHRLVPALTQTSFRARGFGLVCFGLDAARRKPELAGQALDQTFLRFERLVVYAQCLHHPDGMPDDVRYSGTRRAYMRLQSESDLDLNLPLLLHDDLSGGLWASYRRPAMHLGLLRPLGNRSNPAYTGPTKLGESLAKSVEGPVVADPRVTRKLLRDRKKTVTREQATSLIPVDTGTPIPDEVEILSRAMRAYDDERTERGSGRPFAALRKAFDAAGGELALDSINRARLTEGQAQALDDAQALTDLMQAVEEPYRRWVTGNRAALPREVARNPAWARVQVMGEPDLCRLDEDLATSPSFGTVHRHQQRLALERGREPWELDEAVQGREELVSFEFTLPTATRLFFDGVNPSPGRGA